MAARVAGVLRRPRATFDAVARAPRPGPMLALLFVVPFAALAALFATDVGQQALVDQWERTAIAFGQPVGDAEYAALQAASARGVLYAAVTAFVSGPITALGLAAVLVAMFGARNRGAATFTQVLAVTAHAGAVLALRQVVAAPVAYVRETVASPLTLTAVFSTLDEGSPVARFLGLIDLFVVWWLAVLAVGVSVLYRRPAGRLMVLFLGVYVVLALLLAGVMAVLGDGV